MFERKRQQQNEAVHSPEPAEAVIRDPQARKGRPTPTRREREEARKRPLVQPGAARTGAPARTGREERAHARQQMLLGNEKYLSGRDRGPSRSFLRDCVDSRLNVGEFFLPIMLIMLLMMSFLKSPAGQVATIAIVYGTMAILIIDVIWGWLRARRMHIAKFGEKPGRGSAPYVIMRSIQMRRMRMPLPRVKRGEKIL